jgi:predicted unusual protein kinase regulating ubiquinone biosynthesis (AarF/ABC1/UbiB family)
MPDREANTLPRRLSRYARVGAGVGGTAARMAGARLFGRDLGDQKNAADLAAVLGGLKGPLMKVAQLMSTVPDLLSPEFTAELQKLQAEAPPMGPAFVRRRMMAELGPEWSERFREFDRKPAAAASLGQVHRAIGPDGRALACKLQYPNMAAAVEADLGQLGVLLGLHRRMNPEIDTREVAEELADRLREELDYDREGRHAKLFATMLAGEVSVRVPDIIGDLSTPRLLTMEWLSGRPLLDFVDFDLADRNRIATAMFKAWWLPFCRYGVIHGDPHLGNYTVFDKGGGPAGLNLLDFGCVRVFPPKFVAAVIDLYEGLRDEDHERVVRAYESWGFDGLNDEIVDALNIWARFIYAPLTEDRVRTLADGVKPQEYGRREVREVRQRLQAIGTLTIPREFVFMDRAAIGLGSVMLHLRAELNFFQLFTDALGTFDQTALADRQAGALGEVDLGG